MSEQTTTYYAVARLVNFVPDVPGAPVGLKLPAGCEGMFLVFSTREAALEWAEGDVSALRPFSVKVSVPE